MSDKVQIGDSRERVALDLLKIIGEHADGEPKGNRDRTYWLTLYHQCQQATLGMKPTDILNPKAR